MKVSNLLRSLEKGVTDTAKAFARINDNFDLLKRIFQNNVSFGDNVYCDVVTGQFDSGVPRACGLTNLTTCKGAIVVSSSVPCIAAPMVAMSGNTAAVTLFFAQGASNVLATVILLDVGSQSPLTGALTATASAAGLVYPDGFTIGIDANGELAVLPVVQPGWDVVGSFTNSWHAYTGFATFPPASMIDSLGFVHLRGWLIGGTYGLPATTLPGYAQWSGSNYRGFACDTSTGVHGSVTISPAGVLTPSAGPGSTTTGLSLDGVYYDPRV